jgi:hypothetical protein
MTEYRARVWELRAGGVGTLATAEGKRDMAAFTRSTAPGASAGADQI